MVRVELEERSSDPVADRAGLTGDPAALDLDHRVVAAVRVGDLERQSDVVLIDGGAEMLEERSAVDDDLALADEQPDPGDRRLATASPGIERGGGHESSVRRGAQAPGPDGDDRRRRRS